MTLTDDEWRARLTSEQYKVLRERGTEAPGTGKYVHTNEKGMFACAACGNALFSSDTKFESGTGWPSFDRAIPGSVLMKDDSSHGMRRTEVTCAKCGGHLGHLFNDGPATTGQRFCINSCALDMKKGE
jgi:peptide-methionine (R)-S-oxide reductase